MSLLLSEKTERLLEGLRGLESAVVAFSGGVDSTFLAAAARRALGDRSVAVTVRSPGVPSWESLDTERLSERIGIRRVDLFLSELDDEDFVANGPDRCYHCKKFRFEKLLNWAGEQGYRWVLDGSNRDDLDDYRPGMRALSELAGVRSPLLEAGFSKDEIREVSRLWGLSSWRKPSTACLVSRVAYGIPLSQEVLSQVEKAEGFVRSLCPPGIQIRVRHHGLLARIEAEPSILADLAAPGTRELISAFLKDLGFKWVSLDLSGYGMGSMNEAIRSGHDER